GGTRGKVRERISDRARGSGGAELQGHLPVGQDGARGDAPDKRVDPLVEIGFHGAHRIQPCQGAVLDRAAASGRLAGTLRPARPRDSEARETERRAAMAYECIKVEVPEEHIAVVTLNRPQRLNALGITLLEEL